jgi:hypothetical protein
MDDPTMATLPFMAAKTAKEQGHDVVPWLWKEAVTLGRKGVADHNNRREPDYVERTARCCGGCEFVGRRWSGRSSCEGPKVVMRNEWARNVSILDKRRKT